MDNRDHILISWPSRDIEGAIFPVIQELSERFNIIVLVLSTSNSDLMKTKLDSMLNEKVIVDYYMTPKIMHGFYRQNLQLSLQLNLLMLILLHARLQGPMEI